MILIITSEFDVHTDAVIRAFARKGFTDYLRLDLEQAIQNFEIDLAISPRSSHWQLTSVHNHLSVTDQTLTSVWWRRAINQLDAGYLRIPSASTLDSTETYWALRWLVESLPREYFPLGHPVQMRPGENKLKQLAVAASLGFTIPDTVWSNRKPSLLAHATRFPRVAVKPLCTQVVGDSASFSYAGTPLRCNSWTQSDYTSIIETAPSAALYAQNCIDKIADIRITVLPDAVIACEIDTSDLPDGVVDWRQTTINHHHKIIDLPAPFISQLYDFLRVMDLKAGYFDFGLTRDAQFVFFECNSNAQWLWIEELTSYPIADSIARLLIDNHKPQAPNHALQRTAPRVTVAAISYPSVSRPSHLSS